MPGATAGLNAVALSWGMANLADGDEILFSPLDHASAVYPWLNLRQMLARSGTRITLVPYSVTATGEADIGDIRAKLSPRTRLIAAAHVHSVFGATAIGLGTALVLIGAGGGSAGQSRLGGMVRWFGRHSYELYLFHIIVLGLMRTALPRGAVGDAWKPLWLALFLALSALLAWLISRLFSDPANSKLRGLLGRSPSPADAPAADHRLARGA